MSLHRIMYAEDEPDIREIATLALSALGGFEVETCSSGDQVVELAIRFLPDLILLDVMMPGMDGPTALEHLRQEPEFANTPVIFMTAKVMVEEVDRFKELGAIDVIAKPFDAATLADHIREIWNADVE